MPALGGQSSAIGASKHAAAPRSPGRMGARTALTAAFLVALGSSSPCALAQVARPEFHITNGTVNTEVVAGNSLYIGGAFTHVGPVVGCGVPFDPGTGSSLPGFPQVTGQINAVVPDGDGGWYIGGLFTQVGSASRANLARIRSDLSVASWNPGTDGQVLALVLSGGTLFAGGSFTVAGGQSRSRIAAIDTASGIATAWNPGANDVVRALAISGNTLYAGGRFTLLGLSSRARIGALDATTGSATAWNPGASLDVYALATGPATVYAGGLFTIIGGATRNRIAALDSTTGGALAWNPSANAQVNTIVLGSNTLYAGGLFSTIGSAVRLRLAELSLTSGLATAWDPNANGAVATLALSGSTIYAGGDFGSVGGQTRSRLAAISTTTGQASAWNPVAYSTVNAIAASGGAVYAGGTFGGVGGIARNNLAAIDLITGAPTSWNPNVNGQVFALEPFGNKLYVGGSFSQVGGQSRVAIAALDLPSGLVAAWNPGSDGQVTALAVSNGLVYTGGLFSSMGGQLLNNLAAIDTSSALATGWAPEPDGQVYSLLVGDSVIYAGGAFTTAGGQLRSNLAALSPTTGLATSWNPGASGTIRDLAAACGSLYVGGFFTQIGGQSRNRLAALDLATGVPTAWNPNANGPVFCISLNDGVLYAGGVLNMIGGLMRNRLAALDPVSGTATAWNPNLNNTVRAIAVAGGALYAGGSFTSVGTTLQCNVAALPADSSISCPTITVAPSGLPLGIVGTPYSSTLTASGGRSPYCWAVTEGTLPSGLSLASESGVISGTPTTASASAVSITVTDANGCTDVRTYTLDVFGGPIGSTVVASTAGLCVNPAHPCVSVPFVYARDESASVRAVSVTFQIDAARVSLCTPATPGASIHAGSWLDAFPNSLVQVVDDGGGSYTVDAIILGQPCGQTAGGTLFTADLKSVGADGLAAVTVTSVHARDCSNGPVGALPGAPESLLVQNAPVGITPDSLPTATASVAYHQTLLAAPGTAPFTFALTSGALPTGLILTSAGVIDGFPLATGSFAITVGVTDAYGCVGSRAYTLDVVCPLLVLRPGSLPDAVLGTAYAETLTTSNDFTPTSWSVIEGAEPTGLALAASGILSGTTTATGTFTFTALAQDSVGCTGTRSFTLTVFAEPITDTIAPDPTGLCLGVGNPYVAVPFELIRADTTPARAVSVTFQLDTSRIVLRTPSSPDSSVHVGPWFSGTTTAHEIMDMGDGSYTVDVSILGLPCGPTTAGTLFTLDVAAAGPIGPGTLTVIATHLRDCDNAPMPVRPGAPGLVTIGSDVPDAIVDLVATPVLTGNGTGSTTGIQLTWSGGAGDTVKLYRAPYPNYPGYAGAAPDSSGAPGGPWTLAASSATSGYVDQPGTRGFWYYVALVTSACGDTSDVSNRTTGTLDYVLGDVSNSAAPGTGNNAVGMEDISLLGTHYGIGAAQIASRGVGYLDVGPTTDLQLTSRPVPDGSIDFEDLMVFTGNYQYSAALPAGPRLAAREPRASETTPETFRLDAPSSVDAQTSVEATLRLAAAGRMRGFSAVLTWDPTVVEPVSAHSAGFVEAQGGLALSPGFGGMDAALFGTRTQGMTGEGEVARFTFRALQHGEPGLRIARVIARDVANRPLPPEAIAGADSPPAVVETALLAPAPNPFRGYVTLAFTIAHAGSAQLTIYSVDGRRVRVLARGHHDPGIYRIAWDGRDENRARVAPGIYYARFVADGLRLTRRLVHLR